MFDIGWQELFLIGVVALIVVEPKDLPKVLRGAAHVLNSNSTRSSGTSNAPPASTWARS